MHLKCIWKYRLENESHFVSRLNIRPNGKWDLGQNMNIFIEEITLNNVVCQVSAMLSRCQCVKGIGSHSEWVCSFTCIQMQDKGERCNIRSGIFSQYIANHLEIQDNGAYSIYDTMSFRYTVDDMEMRDNEIKQISWYITDHKEMQDNGSRFNILQSISYYSVISIDDNTWGQYAGYAAVTSISNPCGDSKSGGH